MTVADMLISITRNGGSIVSVEDCSSEEVQKAIAENRSALDAGGHIFILRKGERRASFTTTPLHMPRSI